MTSLNFQATPGIEPGIRVLQTLALPLGYVAMKNDSDEVRTRVTAVKGRCLNHLTTEPFHDAKPIQFYI